MKTKKKIKKEFNEFFKKHPDVISVPFVCTIVVPRYECKGERVMTELDELSEDEDVIEKYFDNSDGIKDDGGDEFYDYMQVLIDDMPTISKKDAFYQFDENTLVVAMIEDGEVELLEVDYSDEIFDMY